MKNEIIREKAKKANVFIYQIADELGISEPTMTRMLRYELSKEKQSKMESVIEKISKENHNEI